MNSFASILWREENKRRRRQGLRLQDYPKELRGPPNNRFGGYRNVAIKGFKGNTYGAASPCRTLSEEERLKVEEELREKGLL